MGTKKTDKRTTKKNTVKKKIIVNKKKDNEDDRKKKIILLLLLLLLLFLIFVINVGDLIFDIPTSPKVTNKNVKDEWTNTSMVTIEKDSKTRSGVKYYLYCINKENNSKSCKWNRASSKNIEVTENGINYVFIKAVNENGKEGKVSDPIIVKIDGKAPEIINIKKTEKETSVKVEVDAKDLESGIDKYYYKIDDKEYEESSKNTYTFKDLKENTEYTVTVKVVDKAGNEKVISFKVKTKNSDVSKDTDSATNNDNNQNSTKKDNNKTSSNDKKSDNKKPSSDNDKKPETKPDEVKEIPEISLEDVPLKIKYGDNYKLPSSYKFGKSGGVVSCVVNNKEYKDTTTLPIGKNTINCTAKSNTGIEVKVSKTIEVEINEESEQEWDGWIRMNLYYPVGSTSWQWRIGKEDSIRTGTKQDGWQDYVGPITVRLKDVENIYLRYKLEDGTEQIIAPSGRLLVDIEPDSYVVKNNSKTNVKIVYSEGADKKEYRINKGNWTKYTGSFSVDADTKIEARVIKETDGERQINYDSVYIRIKQENSTSSPSDSSEVVLPSESKEYGTNYEEISDYIIDGPTIKVSPDNMSTEKEVTLETATKAKKIYYKINDGSWNEYKTKFIVNKNCYVYAKYISEDGMTSKISSKYVNGIKKLNKPYVDITYTPTDLAKEVEVTINSDASKVEYSYDGIIYNTYSKPFKVNKNCRVYAKATNNLGETIEYVNITNIGEKAPEKGKLDIGITIVPDNSEVVTNKAEVEIDYDKKADKKYYKIGSSDEWHEYTGKFTVNKNTTIYAYAINDESKGYEEKIISNLTTGISDPIISLNTYSLTPSVKVSISYDKNAKIKRYRIGDGDIQDYVGTFELTQNETIYAYSKDALGNESETIYEVSNISSQPRYLVIDKNDYFILKLNYPLGVNNKEYKWQENGEWKKYDNQGILLIKKKVKDNLLGDKSQVTVEDENGTKITFKDNYYVIDKPLNELIENIYMRWDYKMPDAPSIKLDKTTPTKKVKISITYDKYSYKKEYKLVTKDGIETAWKEYTGSFDIKDNETIIYARGKTDFDEVGKQATVKIVNIDTESPEIDFKADLNTPTRKLTIQLCGNDNLGVDHVGYIKGKKTSKEAIDDGIELSNYSTFDIDENGYYTIYAQDKVGNITSKIIKVENIDKDAPNIDINVITSRYSSETEIEINYDDSDIKEYKIGLTGNYQVYKDKFTIKSEDVYTLENDDNSITIFARGTDKSGNVKEVSKKIYNLDFDMINEPIIEASSGYPKLTEYGFEKEDLAYIIYDNRDDIDNYYSIDDGKTWERYTGPFNVSSETIIAKSIKKISGLTVTKKVKIKSPIDSLSFESYDGNKETYSLAKTIQTFLVDNSLYGSKVKINGRNNRTEPIIKFIDIEGNELSKYTGYKEYEIPENTYKVEISNLMTKIEQYYWNYITEIELDIEPIISSEKAYPKLTEYGFEKGYNIVNIKYYKTSVKKLYSIDDGQTWKEYEKPIKLEIGKTIIAKGVDKNNTQTKEVSYKSILPDDSLSFESYDGNKETYSLAKTIQTFLVDNSLYGSKVKINGRNNRTEPIIKFIDIEGNELSKYTGYKEYEIPENTYKVEISNLMTKIEQYYWNYITEIEINDSPTIIIGSKYPKLTTDGVSEVLIPIKVDYYKTAVKKLYSIDEGKTWKNYENSIQLKPGTKVECKSVDKLGKESFIAEGVVILPNDALGEKAYDGDKNTSEVLKKAGQTTYSYIEIDSSMQGQIIEFTYYAVRNSSLSVTFIAEDGNKTSKILQKSFTDGSKKTTINLNIPDNCVKISFDAWHNNQTDGAPVYYYEITPVISKTQSKATENKAIITAKKKEYVTPPSIEVSNSGIYTISKDVNISYSSGYTNEYSYDAKTWKKYTGTITLSENVTIYARSVKDDKVVASSSYKITKIDAESGEMSLNEIPSKITVGSEYSIPSSYSFNNISGGEVKCYDNDREVSSTKDLSVGSHNIVCISSTKAGITIKITKNIIVEEANKIVEENKIEESKGDDDDEKTPSESDTGTSTKEELETNPEEDKEQ